MESHTLINRNKRLSQVRSTSATPGQRGNALPRLSQTKGQVWGLDLVIAGVIFLIGIVILFYYASNYSPQSKNQLDELFYEGNLASELILSEEDIGILSKGIIDQTKLDNFDDLSDQDKRNSLGLNNNFYFTMDGLEIGESPATHVGIINSSSVNNLVQITRLTIYNDKPTKFQLFMWN